MNKLLKDIAPKCPELSYMLNRLNICSSLAKHELYLLPFITDPEEIEYELAQTAEMIDIIQRQDIRYLTASVRNLLHQVKDIRGTIARLNTGVCLDDIELFEIKAFALLVMELNALMQEADVSIMELPDLVPVADILDPEHTRIPHFYVYDSYSEELARLRSKLREYKTEALFADKTDTLYVENEQLENKIRCRLSNDLRQYATALDTALHTFVRLDILQAKAQQAIDFGLVRPTIAESETSFTAIFNPQVQEDLKEYGKAFQPVDISLGAYPILITGSNMGGKTVLLKTVGLSQLLFQFGFYVPARQASLALTDEVTILSVDDRTAYGLSSYASEIVRLNKLIERIKEGRRVLALIDEPARTTNPREGKAIVTALLDFLAEHRVYSLITTHYSGIHTDCHRLRVRGFVRTDSDREMKLEDIQDYMDYSLVEDNDTKAPREALRIARMLGLDPEIRMNAERYAGNETE